MRTYSGQIEEVTCPRIAVLGTDCAIGKRTTATVLARALNQRGLDAVMIGTGQTGLMQGARYGFALDAVPSWYCAGVTLQHALKRLHRCDFENMEMPDPATEINLVETFSDTTVIGLTINHENMSDEEISAAIVQYKDELGILVTDALARSPESLVELS